MAGDHNVQNALAAVTVALELGATDEQIRSGLAGFGGVKRRFTPAGQWVVQAGAPPVRIIDDYGHHPVEIEAVLKAARAVQGQGQIIAVAQPHRYSRLNDLFGEFSTCFDLADTVLISPVFEAGESPIEGVNATTLVKSIAQHGHKDVRELENLESLSDVIRDLVQPGAMVVCLGAGDITVHANALAGHLAG